MVRGAVGGRSSLRLRGWLAAAQGGIEGRENSEGRRRESHGRTRLGRRLFFVTVRRPGLDDLGDAGVERVVRVGSVSVL